MPGPELMPFDLDDVLCASDTRVRAAHPARLGGRTPGAVFADGRESGFDATVEAGSSDADADPKGCGERIDSPPGLDEWLAAPCVPMTPDREVLELAARARVAVLADKTRRVGETIGAPFPELVPPFGADLAGNVAGAQAAGLDAHRHATVATPAGAPARRGLIEA